MSMLPATGRRKISRADVASIVAAHRLTDKVVIVGIRGYYKRSMGDPKHNDRSIYDDCIAVVTPDRFETFNANVDPSAFNRGVASLVPGVHRYRKGGTPDPDQGGKAQLREGLAWAPR